MYRISWDDADRRYFSTGIDRGVLYPSDEIGVAWNGLVSVNEAPSGSDSSSIFYDGSKIFTTQGVEGFSGTIQAYTYPREFQSVDGNVDFLTGQGMDSFGFSYRTIVANGVDDFPTRHLIHLVYNAKVSSTQRSNQSSTNTPGANLFSWNFVTASIKMGNREGSHLVIDTGMASPEALSELEDLLYGTDTSLPNLPSPDDVIDIFQRHSLLKITDHGDGTWTAEGPDHIVRMVTETMFEINWPSVIYIDSETYEVSSL